MPVAWAGGHVVPDNRAATVHNGPGQAVADNHHNRRRKAAVVRAVAGHVAATQVYRTGHAVVAVAYRLNRCGNKGRADACRSRSCDQGGVAVWVAVVRHRLHPSGVAEWCRGPAGHSQAGYRRQIGKVTCCGPLETAIVPVYQFHPVHEHQAYKQSAAHVPTQEAHVHPQQAEWPRYACKAGRVRRRTGMNRN